MEAEYVLELLSEAWDAEYLASLGEDCDRPSFMAGYASGFREGAFTV